MVCRNFFHTINQDTLTEFAFIGQPINAHAINFILGTACIFGEEIYFTATLQSDCDPIPWHDLTPPILRLDQAGPTRRHGFHSWQFGGCGSQLQILSPKTYH